MIGASPRMVVKVSDGDLRREKRSASRCIVLKPGAEEFVESGQGNRHTVDCVTHNRSRVPLAVWYPCNPCLPGAHPRLYFRRYGLYGRELSVESFSVLGESAVQVAASKDAGPVRGPDTRRRLERLGTPNGTRGRSLKTRPTRQGATPSQTSTTSSRVIIWWSSARNLQ